MDYTNHNTSLRTNKHLSYEILGYRTPREAFLDEIRKLTDVTSVQFHIAI